MLVDVLVMIIKRDAGWLASRPFDSNPEFSPDKQTGFQKTLKCHPLSRPHQSIAGFLSLYFVHWFKCWQTTDVRFVHVRLKVFICFKRKLQTKIQSVAAMDENNE